MDYNELDEFSDIIDAYADFTQSLDEDEISIEIKNKSKKSIQNFQRQLDEDLLFDDYE